MDVIWIAGYLLKINKLQLFFLFIIKKYLIKQITAINLTVIKYKINVFIYIKNQWLSWFKRHKEGGGYPAYDNSVLSNKKNFDKEILEICVYPTSRNGSLNKTFYKKSSFTIFDTRIKKIRRNTSMFDEKCCYYVNEKIQSQ